jgi:2-polyprenyl-3-methyl-5-hydroxy-6-metoxy-1,4-benzoquinol methylase
LTRTRFEQAIKIKNILRDFLKSPLSDKLCLEVGCADGAIGQELADDVQAIWGFDIDPEAIKNAHHDPMENHLISKAHLEAMPFDDDSFHIVICTQVYEHTSQQKALSEEIWRVLKPGGVCFFSGPNKFAVMEDHYKLPFLSWIPQSMANRYMKLFNKGEKFDILPRSYSTLKQLFHKFQIIHYTSKLIKQPEKFLTGAPVDRLKKLKWIPLGILKRLEPIYPNFNWILLKTSKPSQ